MSDHSKYLKFHKALEAGLVSKDTKIEFLPMDKSLYKIDIVYQNFNGLLKYDGKHTHQVCIHFRYKEECENGDCPFNVKQCAERRKEMLLKRYPNINLSKYCKHMFKCNTCKYCFKSGLTVNQRCKCGNIWRNCETCESDGTNKTRRYQYIDSPIAEYQRELKREKEYEQMMKDLGEW